MDKILFLVNFLYKGQYAFLTFSLSLLVVSFFLLKQRRYFDEEGPISTAFFTAMFVGLVYFSLKDANVYLTAMINGESSEFWALSIYGYIAGYTGCFVFAYAYRKAGKKKDSYKVNILSLDFKMGMKAVLLYLNAFLAIGLLLIAFGYFTFWILPFVYVAPETEFAGFAREYKSLYLLLCSFGVGLLSLMFNRVYN